MDFLSKVQMNYHRDLYALAINTGLRLGEIAAIQRMKIDFNKKIITVSNSLKRKKGGGFRLGPTKNKLTHRFPMNQTVYKILQRKVVGKQRDDFLFTNRHGGPIDVNHFCERQFRPNQERVGIANTLRFHDLRHTYASNFMMNGGELFTLQKLLGHKKVEATLIYAHLSPSYLQDAASLVDFAVETA